MREGFIFDYSRCVNCKACSAACILYNKGPLPVRNVFTYNSEACAVLPVISLSLACNHCETAICMEGCPASAYRRDEATGAVIIDGKKCIGCRYCQWNCPYDAPKFDPVNRTISKCSLCQSILPVRGKPACTDACPTGALSFGLITGENSENKFKWFPDKKLNPAIHFSSEIRNVPLDIIPEGEITEPVIEVKKRNVLPELSLVIFSFLSVLSVSDLISSFIKGIFPLKVMFVSVLMITGLVSLFHLGRKTRFWRSISNLKNSPLSREIAAFIIYAVISSYSVIYQIPALIIIASIAGLGFLFLIDSVYIYSCKTKYVFMHSGQTFISALLIISFFSGIILPFIFLALLKLISSVIMMTKTSDKDVFRLRFLRLVFLVLPALSFITGKSYNEFFVILVFLTGELFDRILFYMDFNPVNINNLITEQLNIEKNEKKGS